MYQGLFLVVEIEWWTDIFIEFYSSGEDEQ
jgi:hypothetical protein